MLLKVRQRTSSALQKHHIEQRVMALGLLPIKGFSALKSKEGKVFQTGGYALCFYLLDAPTIYYVIQIERRHEDGD